MATAGNHYHSTVAWTKRSSNILSDFRVKNYSTKMGILQELVWQELGLWMRRVWWKLESWRRCSLFREREKRPLWLLVSCSALLHLQSLNLPGSQLERSLCNILSEHQNIRKWMFTTSYSGPAYLSSFSPATISSLAYSAIHPKNLISVSTILFVPSVFVHPFIPIQKGQKRGHPFAFSQVPEYPQQCFGS